MIPAEICQRIKELELYTRRLMNAPLMGDFTSCVKGSGLLFDQIRDYQIGDDVRFIDWNSSARMNKLLVKQFYEEKHRVILLALDISASTLYGTMRTKYDAMAQIAGIIAFAAEFAKDSVGLVLFAHEVYTYIPPGKGRKHIYHLLEQIFKNEIYPCQTDLNSVLQYLAQLHKKDAMVILISDFIQEKNFERNLALVSRLYDVIALRVIHTYEQSFVPVGLLTVRDSETGEEAVLDTRTAQGINYFLPLRLQEQQELFKRYGIDAITITGQQQPVPVLVHFFKKRKR